MQQNLPQELTQVTFLSKMLAALLFIFLPILMFFIGMSYGEMKVQSANLLNQEDLLYNQSQPSAIPTITIPADWKTYKHTNPVFNIQHPTSWTEKQSKEGNMSNVTLTGKEGEVSIYWGQGFGGMCGEGGVGYTKMIIDGQTVQVCHLVDEKGVEHWEQIIFKKKNTSYGLRALASSPKEAHSQTILRILSSFKVE
jgi:hypothetical protein